MTFRDETVTGRPIDEIKVPGLPESMTVRGLVRLRVREEVARFRPVHINRLVLVTPSPRVVGVEITDQDRREVSS